MLASVKMGEHCLKRCVLLAAGRRQSLFGDASCRGLVNCRRNFGYKSDNKEEVTLVEELKMRFRTKAIGNPDLTKISIQDIREIWMDTIVTQQALRSIPKIDLDPQIFKDMEIRLREVFEEWEEDGKVDYEDYLPVMVDLIKPNVSRTDLLEVSNELFDIYFPDYSGMPMETHGKVWQPRPQAMLQNLKIKSCYRTLPGRSNIEIMKNIEENESHRVHDNGNVFSLWEFVMKMVNVPVIRGIGG